MKEQDHAQAANRPQNEAKAVTAMTDDTNTNETMQGIEEEINTVLAGQNPLHNLHASRVSFTEYRVLSARNGNVSTHLVDAKQATCTCEDEQYNTQGNQVCAHVAFVLLQNELSTKDVAMHDVAELYSRAADLVEEAENSRQVWKRTQESNGVASASDTGGSTTPTSQDTPDVGAAADKLQDAYDQATDGMNVEAAAGMVWVNKTPDAPDYTFQAFLQDPEQVEYIHDDHELSGSEPGEYFQNAISPEDVDAYIEEVLE